MTALGGYTTALEHYIYVLIKNYGLEYVEVWFAERMLESIFSGSTGALVAAAINSYKQENQNVPEVQTVQRK